MTERLIHRTLSKSKLAEIVRKYGGEGWLVIDRNYSFQGNVEYEVNGYSTITRAFINNELLSNQREILSNLRQYEYYYSVWVRLVRFYEEVR